MGDLKLERTEVSHHSTEWDCWIIIDNNVYDLSKFIGLHPGGLGPILEYAGKDATEAFYSLHRQETLLRYQRYKIGTLMNEEPKIHVAQPGDISSVPYSESSAWMGFKSPYFKESHARFRSALRKTMDSLAPEARGYEDSGDKPSTELLQKLGDLGILAANIGPGPWLKSFRLVGDVKPEEFDYFHEMIAHEETARWTSPGTSSGIFGGMVISLPTVINFGRPEIQAKVIPEVLSGRKRMCLAITEPYTGSDVANIQTIARRTADGKYYIVNGTKKWITAGMFADYFSVAVRTEGGISMLLVERGEGVETKPIKTSYSASAGTSYVMFENVKVPVENLLGKENQGFKVILSNFNHERWVMLTGASMGARVVIQDCFKWANQRQVFGKRLIDQPVIRNKLAKMVAAAESTHNWLENITYQMCHMDYKEQSQKLAGPLALCKFRMTRMLHEISDDACQIFGGRAITRGGMGRSVESMQRTYKFSAILGGAEEIMADLGIRQAMRHFPENARL
ncbi:hypothetical protein EC973_005515 [Apophysomyces ossiformis]|uniref:Cytochrome b5 heme-binding domain-containing protein n=1 Tax=Apophysomyces ossiformis TaxID=679940 RepID=A0A8H7BDV5_9FUNG|nr:hypothetical protein EC973_005515 [Apophysomyces ossiformis]